MTQGIMDGRHARITSGCDSHRQRTFRGDEFAKTVILKAAAKGKQIALASEIDFRDKFPECEVGDENLEILTGHGRYFAAQKLKL
jgi:hypothetical protein